MSEDHSELQRLAEAATPGPWNVANNRYGGVIRGGPVQEFTNGSAQSQIVMCCGAEWMEPGQLERNAEFIAAANPTAVLALLTESRRNAVRLEVSEDTRVVIRNCLKTAESEIEQLKAKNEALRKALSDVREAVQREYWDEYAGLDETRGILDAALGKDADQ
jgi:hypothetical protein